MSPYAWTVVTAVLSSAIWPAVLPKLIEYKNRKKTAEAERHDHDRDAWFRESKEAYAVVKKECVDCKKELQRVRDAHERQLGALRRELNDVKDALVGRIDAFDEVLPFVQGLAEDKVYELRAANRAVRTAVYRSRP